LSQLELLAYNSEGPHCMLEFLTTHVQCAIICCGGQQQSGWGSSYQPGSTEQGLSRASVAPHALGPGQRATWQRGVCVCVCVAMDDT
jgi:hypothetical protein